MADNRVCCKYWDRCFQKHPEHFKRFRHPVNLTQRFQNDFRNNQHKRKLVNDNKKEVKSEEPKAKKPNVSSDSDKTSAEKTQSNNSTEKAITETKLENTVNTEKTENTVNTESSAEPKTTENTKGTVDLKSTEITANLENIENSLEPKTTEGTTQLDGTKSSENSGDIEINKSTVDLKSTENTENNLDLGSTENAADLESVKDTADPKSSGNATDPKSSENATDPKSSGNAADLESSGDATDLKNTKNTEVLEEKQSDPNTEKIDDSKTISKTEDIKSRDVGQETKKVTENKEKIASTSKIESNAKTETSIGNSEPKNEEKDIYAEAKDLILKVFLMPMPDDFYKFYEFCKEQRPSDPATAFRVADLKLVGPYDVLLGLINNRTKITDNLLTHWRYFYDPPEFQTIIKGNDREGFHFGYWRDRPSTSPIFVATNSLNVSHKIKPVAENIFGAVGSYLEERAKKATTFEKPSVFNLFTKLKAFAAKHNITLETQTIKMKSRDKTVVARTIHGAGIVCPFNRKTQVGYRPISVPENELLKIIKKINDASTGKQSLELRKELDEVVRLATIAADECDFGTCLELGHDLLSSGSVHVKDDILSTLNIAYSQLERHAFLKIIQAHMANRRRGTSLSSISVK